MTAFAATAILVSAIAVGQAQQPPHRRSTPAPPAPPGSRQAGPPQQRPDPMPPDDLPRPSTTDPRANLKPGGPGVKAAEAAWNMELVSNLPKPEGFYDKDMPLGTRPPQQPEPAPGAPRTPPNPNQLSYTNSDLAFSGNHVVVGNYHGFNTYNIERANKPQLIASVVCPGGQGDVSIWGNLLFMSVEQTRGRVDCGLQGVVPPVSNERFRGVRIFDITDLKNPKQVAAVQTCRGSHTHTLVPDPRDKSHIFLYASGTGGVRSGEELVGCSGKDPKDDPNTSLFSIDVIEVPIANPSQARIVNQPRLFASTEGNLAGLWMGGDHGAQHAAHQHHEPVPRHHGVFGDRPGRGRVLGQRHPDGHQRSAQSEAPRLRVRHGLCLLALGDVQQRRHQGPVHRRVGRRRPSALPRGRSADLGRRCHLRHRRQEAGAQGLLQDAGGADRAGKLRGPQRLADSGPGPRHHGAGVVPGRPVGVRLHRFGDTRRKSPTSIAVRSTAKRCCRAATGRRTGTTATSTARRWRAASTCSA